MARLRRQSGSGFADDSDPGRPFSDHTIAQGRHRRPARTARAQQAGYVALIVVAAAAIGVLQFVRVTHEAGGDHTPALIGMLAGYVAGLVCIVTALVVRRRASVRARLVGALVMAVGIAAFVVGPLLGLI